MDNSEARPDAGNDQVSQRDLPEAAGAAATAPLAPLPQGIRPGEMVRVSVPGYRSARVVHGAEGTTRAMVYLHGVCGDVGKMASFTEAASRKVTTIAVLGDEPCEGSARFRWSGDLELIHILVQRALRATQQARGGALDIERVVLFGYSQGSIRAEKLGERYPRRYPWLILGGMPRTPDAQRLARVRATTVLMGGLEPTAAALREETETLARQGITVQFRLFPEAGHGQFGPQAERVITESLSWLFSR